MNRYLVRSILRPIVLGILAAGLVSGACAAREVSLVEPLGSAPSPAEAAVTSEPATSEPSTSIDHSAWADFLSKYVVAHDSGIDRVDYGGVTADDRERLDDYLEKLQAISISTYEDIDEQMAFWINLYNALTVQVILEHYPIASIMDIDLTPPYDGPWDAKLVRVEGQDLTLNEICTYKLRFSFNDPLLHYAINCASFGCPNLARDPFTADNLDELLDNAAEAFVNHPRGVRFEDDRLIVSSIFVWFLDDFGGSHQELFEHLREYASDELADRLASYSGAVEHDYDWRLNKP